MTQKICHYYWVEWHKKYAIAIGYNGTKNMPLILGGMAQKICHYYWVEWHKKYAIAIGLNGTKICHCYCVQRLKKYATDIGRNGTKNMPLLLGGMAQKICH